MSLNLYNQFSSISEDFMGSVGIGFVNSLIEYHLGIEPKDLTKADLSRLIDWVDIAASLTIKDQTKVIQYVSKLKQAAGMHSA